MNKNLVAYFSAGGVTGKVAEHLAEAANADLFEIRPETPYTDADLRWTNPLARCNREKLGKKDVPIAGRVENMDEYDVIFLGFPIWYYAAPNIIQTFVRSYDFSGKKLALFATSGGSDISKAADKLRPFLSQSVRIVAARLFQPGDDEDTLKNWVEEVLAK